MRKLLVPTLVSLMGCNSDWQIVPNESYGLYDSGVEDTGNLSTDISCDESTFEYKVDGTSRPECFAIDSYQRDGGLCGHIFYLGCMNELGGVVLTEDFDGAGSFEYGESSCGNGFFEVCVFPEAEGTYKVSSWLYTEDEKGLEEEEKMDLHDPVRFFVVATDSTVNGTVHR